ncbi:hypothetical protein PLESTM_000166500 [Pleodorina starrii]|nr:hypothetical protein PLESTM_000166500 [Pleodorina starrii]
MATIVQVVMQSQPVPNDDTPLLGDGPVSTNDRALVSPLTAHRRRLEALVRAGWDSGVACVCCAALVFSFAALFVKLMGSSIPVFQIVAFRSLASFAICAAYARAARISPLFGRRANLRFLISRGLFGAAAMTTYYFSIRMLPLADAVTLFFLNPAITAVVAWAILKEPLGLRGVCGVLVSVCGLILLTRPPFLFGHTGSGSSAGGLHGDGGVGVGTAGAGDGAGGGWDRDRLLGSMFGLLSALLSAGAFISIRYIGKSEPALVVSVYFHVCAAGSSLAPLAAGVPAPAVWPSGPQWALLAGVGCCSFWGQILIGRSFQLLNAARASAINLTQVVYSYLLGLIFLHESLTLFGGGGSVLIAAGAVLVNLRPKKPPPAADAAAPAKEDADAPATGWDNNKDGTTTTTTTATSGDSEAVPAEDCGAGRHQNGVAVVQATGGSGAALELVAVWRGGGSGDGRAEEGRRGPWRGAEQGELEVRPLLPGPAELPGQRGSDGAGEADAVAGGVGRQAQDAGMGAATRGTGVDAAVGCRGAGGGGGDGALATFAAMAAALDPGPGCSSSSAGGVVHEGGGRQGEVGGGGGGEDWGGGQGPRPADCGTNRAEAASRSVGSSAAASPPDSAGG